MKFKNPLSGSYMKINIAYMRERASRENDPRSEFYKAILAYDNFHDYYREAGDEYVQPSTTSFPVSADMEIKYAVRRKWVLPISTPTA
jgi:hypothetical protein